MEDSWIKAVLEATFVQKYIRYSRSCTSIDHSSSPKKQEI